MVVCTNLTLHGTKVFDAYFYVFGQKARALCSSSVNPYHFYRATACNATDGIAVGILSVRLSDACIVTKTKQRTATILIPHETAITLVF